VEASDEVSDLRRRLDELAHRVDENRDMISELQAEGLVSQEHAEQLGEALVSSRVIGAAMGIIMAKLDVDQVKAFAVLKRVSQDSNRKLREVASEVVETRSLAPMHPSPLPGPDAATAELTPESRG
jgi:predicted transcriptional regulator